MRWILILTILSGGYDHSSSTEAVAFASKDACEAAAKSHEAAVKALHWQALAVVWTCSPDDPGATGTPPQK